MKDNKKKTVFFGINEKYAMIIAVAVFLILLIPTVYLGKYDFMKADDYTYGGLAHRTYMETGSYFQALKAGFKTVKTTYETWQGTFSSVFLMAVFPSIVNYRFYKLVPAIMVFSITAAMFYLSDTLVYRVLKGKRVYSIITGALLSMTVIERMYTVPGAIYWYNAAVHYIFAHSCFVILATACINICITKQKVERIILIVLSLILAIEVGGSNYATILIASVSLVSLTVILFVTTKKKAFFVLPAVSVELAATIINVCAPGNKVRGSNYSGNSAVKSILMSFKSAGLYSIKWFDLFTLVILVMFIPVFWNIASKISYKFKCHYLVLIYSFCVIATGFTSSYFSMGDAGLSRTQNVIKITWQILLLVNEAYIIGYIRKKFGKRDMSIPFLALVLCYALLLIPPATIKKLGTITSYTAFEFLIYGHAGAFWNENMERLAILENPEITEVEFRPHSVTPFYLYVSDITYDANNWENTGMAGYYGKTYVKLVDPIE